MDTELSASEREWQQQIRRYADERVAPGSREREEAHEIPHALIREMAERGLLGVNVSKDFGGVGRGVVPYAIAMREIGRADASVAVTMAVTNMAAEVIIQFGTAEQRQKYVPRITSGEFFGAAFALSEQGSGSDAASMTTRAERKNGGWVLNGEKMWITTGDLAGVFVLWARTGGPGARGVSCFLVEPDAPGFSAGKPEEKLGLRASHTTSLTLDDVQLPASALLGEVGGGFKVAMVALDGGRIGVGAQASGIGKAALNCARDIATEATTSGRLADQQGVQFQIADMATELDAGWLLTLRAAWLKDQKDRRFSREAAMAKVVASEAANRATRAAVQIAGGRGHMDDYLPGRLMRDCRVTQIYEGTSEVQRLVIGREVLKSGVAP
ncbi:acyl-CoA dehydrogenase family protein [Myxococcota bacterium]